MIVYSGTNCVIYKNVITKRSRDIKSEIAADHTANELVDIQINVLLNINAYVINCDFLRL